MDNLMGLLRVHVKRGVNLAVRDVRSSDPYVVVKMGQQRLKSRVVKKDVNPEWNDDLSAIYRSLENTYQFGRNPKWNRAIKITTSTSNCLAEESPVYLNEGKIVQDLVLRLRTWSVGEVEIQLEWIHFPGSKAFLSQ
ncbi:protein C2-DOMAIN ABA-RELATED 4-like [Hibiscus syriacus]|uniref:protein C2-DOMAIN ABA-RELATED 4-like n=1 Tax=Hibiscus syriacus TaxID=106335 RepID=UPI001923B1A0|nr:protein C2-DOMAIN ABA-RELATED 4-like [Hibiscus syriacus]